MHKVNHFLLASLFLPLLIVSISLAHSSASARQLTSEERKFYAQNNILFTVPTDGSTTVGDGCFVEFGDTGEDNAKTALIYLMSVGYSPVSAAAIVGVMRSESGLIPNILEGGRRVTDDSFRADTWDCKGQNGGKCGFGLMQWTDKEEKENLQSLADQENLPVTSLQLQLLFLVRDLACSKEGDCDRNSPDAMHKNTDAYAYFDVDSLNAYSARSVEEAVFWLMRRYTIPYTICSGGSDGICERGGRILVDVPRSYPAGADAIRHNGGGSYLSSGNAYIDLANELSGQLSQYCSSASSGSGSGNSSGGTTVSGPDGINISTEVFKPCPSDMVKTSTHSGNTYDYTYSGTKYKVANTKLDLDSYMQYLSNRHIGQDGQTCDPLTGKCYNGTIGDYNYSDWGHCLHFATVFAGNLSSGNCTSTDYGAANYAGAATQLNPYMNDDEANGKLPTLQGIYDYILSGHVVVAKVASGTSRHFVVAVGVKASANRANLTDSDFLWLDTNGKFNLSRKLYFQAGHGGYWFKEA